MGATFSEPEYNYRLEHYLIRKEKRELYKKESNLIGYWKNYENVDKIFEELVRNYDQDKDFCQIEHQDNFKKGSVDHKYEYTGQIHIDKNTVQQIPFFDWIENKKQIIHYQFDSDHYFYEDLIIFQNNQNVYCLAKLELTLFSPYNNNNVNIYEDEVSAKFFFSKDLEFLKKKYLGTIKEHNN